ncbi:MAG: hypothetical protein KA354_15035 [Phycisphaerae bacterium]|nr:hypothetical protein [Phycisphaerae bacterium]
MKQASSHRPILISALLVASCSPVVLAQLEAMSNGNLRGIRIDGELMAFTAGIRVTAAGGSKGGPTGVGRSGGGRYSRQGMDLVVTGDLSSPPGGPGRRGRRGTASYRTVYRQTAADAIHVDIQMDAIAETPMGGVSFVVTLPGVDYAGSSAYLIEPVDTQIALAATRPSVPNLYLRASAKGVRVGCPRRQFEIAFDAPREVIIQDDRTRGNGDIELAFPLSKGSLAADQHIRSGFSIKATGEVDRSAVALAMDASRPGCAYDGIGGNFRIQSWADAAHIEYNLDHLRVAWGRVAMPLDRWQPDEDADPVAAAAAGQLDGAVRQAMEMAGALAKRRIPTIASVWSAPRWALGSDDGKGGQKRLNPEKWDRVCAAIGGYLEYLGQHYGAEPVLFSFNESDMGIDVLQSPQEHAEAIKRLGGHFASRRLATRMILGDTGNPTATHFIEPAMADPEVVKSIGAVSFHSWWGGTTEQYTRFSEAARRLQVPLIVGEGGVDPFAYRVRDVLIESWYALEEISQYVEICRVAQPRSILHWQLTADYSVLTGGLDGRPLEPTQRFWQLKQLGMTSVGAASVPMTCDRPGVVSCAFVDRGSYVVHLVNKGAARKAGISGFPRGMGAVRVYVTDGRRGMQESGRVPVVDGKVELSLDRMSLTSVVAKPDGEEGALPSGGGGSG